MLTRIREERTQLMSSSRSYKEEVVRDKRGKNDSEGSGGGDGDGRGRRGSGGGGDGDLEGDLIKTEPNSHRDVTGEEVGIRSSCLTD